MYIERKLFTELSFNHVFLPIVLGICLIFLNAGFMDKNRKDFFNEYSVNFIFRSIVIFFVFRLE